MYKSSGCNPQFFILRIEAHFFYYICRKVLFGPGFLDGLFLHFGSFFLIGDFLHFGSRLLIKYFLTLDIWSFRLIGFLRSSHS